MTTLLLTENFPPRTGGSGRWLWEIYRRLPRDRFAVAAGEHPKQAEFDRGHDLRLWRVPLTLPDWGLLGLEGLYGYWRALQAVVRIVRSEHVTRLHCGACLPDGWVALVCRRWLGLPYVVHVHGEEVNLDGPGDTPGIMASRQLRWMTRQVLLGAETIIANSRNTAGLLRHQWHLPERRIRLLYPGVDTRRFVLGDGGPGARRQLGWQHRSVVLTVGRLQKRKGHDQMIRALPRIREAVPDVLYAVLGDGEERAALHDLVAREKLGDHVQFLGEVDDEQLVQCYQSCDVFVLPNRQVGNDIEGFGMVLLEAQACGKPVVAGASGGTAETMRIPETGRVVPCDGPEQLAAAVTELLTDPEQRRRMGAAARQWVAENFDWEALTRQAEPLLAGREPIPGLSPEADREAMAASRPGAD
jgi:phosphatidylinositol alpha-1,6-mannosyltransferase